MKNITLKEHVRLHGAFTVFAFAALGFMVLVILVMYFNISSLKKTVKTQVYVAVDGKMYQARPEQRTGRDELDYRVFVETWAYNMFSHDVNSLDERLKIAKPLIYDKGYKYILSTYTTGKNAGWEEGIKNIRTLYQTRDARTYFTIDSIKVNMEPKNKIVQIYGKQKAVFAVGQDSEARISFETELEETDKSNSNPYGLTITRFVFIN
ncbi:MAG: hypothetical protein ACWA6U_16790 [Breznakibacter sp.]